MHSIHGEDMYSKLLRALSDIGDPNNRSSLSSLSSLCLFRTCLSKIRIAPQRLQFGESFDPFGPNRR